jgi:hypothetical protein
VAKIEDPIEMSAEAAAHEAVRGEAVRGEAERVPRSTRGAPVSAVVVGILAIAAALQLLAFAIMALNAARERAKEQRVLEAREIAAEMFRLQLENAAYWFSEDPPTVNLLLGFSKREDVSTLRMRWREERKAAK